ncbi:Outer membrane protein assembly factor BamB [subsurface metagenome]
MRAGVPVGRNDRRRRIIRFIPAASVLVLVVALSSCRSRSDWVKFRGEQGSGSTPNAVYPPLGVKWKLRLQPETQKAYAFNNPVVLGSTIYFGSTDGNFYALDIESGYMRWVFKTGGSINSVPYADDEKVYFGANDGRAYALRREDGSEAWSYDTGRTVSSTVIGYEDYIIFISDGGAVFFFSPDGVLQHELPNPAWYNFSFQVHEDVMYFAPGPPDRPVSFGAYNVRLRMYEWVIETASIRAWWYSFPALKDSRLFFATADNPGEGRWEFRYYAHDRSTGQLLWKYTDFSHWGFNRPAEEGELWYKNLDLLDYLAPALWRNHVIYTSGDALVRAFHVGTGRVVWTHALDGPASAAPAVAGNRVYFGVDGSMTEAPKLVALSARNGRKLWEMEIDGALMSAPLIAGKWIIFGTDRNVFYVLEELF